MKKTNKLTVNGSEISLIYNNQQDYISLTDIAKYRNKIEPFSVINNWMRSRSTIEFIGLWEKIYNNDFKPIEFDRFKKEAGNNYFTLSPQRWIETTCAIGICTRSGRYGGGTFAHKDIAFEFASWISSEFKLYLIKEFQKLKEDENNRLKSEWNLQRTLAKINYHIHTDAIREKLIPSTISDEQAAIIYATEADLLNVALFGKTAAEFKIENPDFEGNLRDNATLEQLVVLTNLESINSVMIKQNLSQKDRLGKLNEIAISQMKSLLGSVKLKALG